MRELDYRAIGRRVRAERQKKKLTQERLGELCGLSTAHIGHIERGTRIASIDTLVDLCNTLHVSPDYLLSASLDQAHYTPEFSPKDRAKLSELLRMAQDAVQNWDK